MKALLLGIFFVGSLLLALISQLPDNKLHVFLCDVGQGDGILIQKGTTQLVIDGGPDNSLVSCLGSHMPFWDHTIEVAILTHGDSDHFFGFIEMAKRYQVKHLVGSQVDNESREFARLKEVVSETHIPITIAHAGQEIKANGVSFRIVFPSTQFVNDRTKENPGSTLLGSRQSNDRNSFCIVGLLTYGNFAGLFTCDISPASEKWMLEANIVPKAYFLKVSHHGSKNGLIPEFLQAVNPTVAGISVGKKNRYGHPSPEVITMLKDFGAKVVRTDETGEVELVTDGSTVWVHE